MSKTSPLTPTTTIQSHQTDITQDSFQQHDPLTSEAIMVVLSADEKFIPNVQQAYQDALLEYTSTQDPRAVEDFAKCIANETFQKCTPIFAHIARNQEHGFNNHLNALRRIIYKNDLWQNFNPLTYASPFWYEGAGNAWRHATFNQHTRESFAVCEKTTKEADRCLADPTLTNDYCFRLYQHKVACGPGLNCPYLRFPLLKCMQKGDTTDYMAFTACAKSIPKFESCTKSYTPKE
jgi:hypothetical protein